MLTNQLLFHGKKKSRIYEKTLWKTSPKGGNMSAKSLRAFDKLHISYVTDKSLINNVSNKTHFFSIFYVLFRKRIQKFKLNHPIYWNTFSVFTPVSKKH